ncbi:MAG: hypothetical protein V1846_05655 [Candidatus Komeilibacteria bacterium]
MTSKLIVLAICLVAVVAAVLIVLQLPQIRSSFRTLEPGGISNFEECKKAGYPIMETYPEQCRIPGGQTFVADININTGEQGCQSDLSCPVGQSCNQGVCETRVPITPKPLPIEPSLCRNLCGDNICQEVVCLGGNCPCAETAALCPQDCATK